MRKTRLQCAKKMGVSIKTLCDWERGRRIPNKNMRDKIISFFGHNTLLD